MVFGMYGSTGGFAGGVVASCPVAAGVARRNQRAAELKVIFNRDTKYQSEEARKTAVREILDAMKAEKGADTIPPYFNLTDEDYLDFKQRLDEKVGGPGLVTQPVVEPESQTAVSDEADRRMQIVEAIFAEGGDDFAGAGVRRGIIKRVLDDEFGEKRLGYTEIPSEVFEQFVDALKHEVNGA